MCHTYSMTKTATILAGIIIFILGFTLAYFILPLFQTDQAVVITEQANESETNEAEIENAFFAFADTYTNERDMGTPGVLLFSAEFDLMAFRYATSQESSQFGVYDYAHD